jgi:phosphoribosylformylglycinamidine cyclo-ligase
MAHITGGGITENLPRVLPDDLCANISLSAWEFPAIFNWLQQQGNVSLADMLVTFNCGIGMIVCVASEDEAATLQILAEQNETAFSLGEIVIKTSEAQSVNYFS